MRRNGSLFAGLVTVLLAVLLILLAVPVTVVTSYITPSVTSRKLIWILILAAGVAAAGVMTWWLWHRTSNEDAAPDQQPVPDPPIVVGEIPREPPAFVNRATVGRLAAAAESRRAAVVCAVTGLRGVGKTQVAAAYARSRIECGWGLVGWVNAESPDMLLTGRSYRESPGVPGVLPGPAGDIGEAGAARRDRLVRIAAGRRAGAKRHGCGG